ncbi:MAG: sulfide/dihydroorotate dehydrogenase-like FAD/NAD-binding protein [Verrucomicrobiae bacterium]|nr:sulfide/dihydroorotate dehydrogenase-like FAD/NAD-binding protein [Verrucomicrobiae bacterium]
MNKVVSRQQLSRGITRLEIQAPRIAEIRQPGQFVIVCLAEDSERIPLTIADSDPQRGNITLVIQNVGHSTQELGNLRVGESLFAVTGPLGHPTELPDQGCALCVGGGVGAAVVHPIAQGLHRRGVKVTSIIGARTREQLIFETELRRFGDLIVCTDDGSHGCTGLVTDPLRTQLAAGPWAVVYAVGPAAMMQAVAELTRPAQIRTIVSLNPVMIDGTGMCGGCRVSVGGVTKFACVDGPEFDGHLVDYHDLLDRLTTYHTFEKSGPGGAKDHCKL